MQENAKIAKQKLIIPNLFFLYFFRKGKDRKAKNKAKPKCIALAGTSINTPKPKINGRGEAYQSWNKDHVKATMATSCNCQPVNTRALPSASSTLRSISLVLMLMKEKKPALKNKMRALNKKIYYIQPCSV